MFYLHTELGAYLAANSIGVVFGGSRCGLLGKMGDALVANGGRLTGIVPEFFTSEILHHPAYSLSLKPKLYQRYCSLENGLFTTFPLMECLQNQLFWGGMEYTRCTLSLMQFLIP